jgi:hypothetical protein
MLGIGWSCGKGHNLVFCLLVSLPCKRKLLKVNGEVAKVLEACNEMHKALTT